MPPCIPFQYVCDGCYARAHQMRRIILKRWGYCVEKVFSFATDGNDTLAVKADKWGGGCVEWWYHVVPLLRTADGRVDVMFYESARIYWLKRDAPDYEATLRAAAASGARVRVRLTTPQGDEIEEAAIER